MRTGISITIDTIHQQQLTLKTKQQAMQAIQSVNQSWQSNQQVMILDQPMLTCFANKDLQRARWNERRRSWQGNPMASWTARKMLAFPCPAKEIFTNPNSIPRIARICVFKQISKQFEKAILQSRTNSRNVMNVIFTTTKANKQQPNKYSRTSMSVAV
jgi:hypothetical protein